MDSIDRPSLIGHNSKFGPKKTSFLTLTGNHYCFCRTPPVYRILNFVVLGGIQPQPLLQDWFNGIQRLTMNA